MVLLLASLGSVVSGVLLDPKAIPKFINQLSGAPPFYKPTIATDPTTGAVLRHEYTIDMTEFHQQILPPAINPVTGVNYPTTKVWGYGGTVTLPNGTDVHISNSPGPSFEAVRGVPIEVKWVNKLTGSYMFAIDPTLMWADPEEMSMMLSPPYEPFPPGEPMIQSPVVAVPHLHGGEVSSLYDGGPQSWWTASGIHGPSYHTAATTDLDSAIYHYPNSQQAGTLWYHDHTMGATRISVLSGLAGFYLLRDPLDPLASLLPSEPEFDVPLAIQDRTFNDDGSFWYPNVGLNPSIHPYWQPEFFGNAIMVNGLVWPNMKVKQGQYRFRVLDGSHARFYTLSMSNKMPFRIIGSEGGYIKSAVTVTEFTIAPGERIEVLVDFSGIAPQTSITLLNSAKTPFPSGKPADPQTVGQIMKFTVLGEPGFTPKPLPPLLNPTLEGAFPTLTSSGISRILTLQEVMGPEGPQEILLDGQKYMAPISELPKVGTTEDWIIVNPTADTHPIHLHLVQFQIVSRQPFQAKKYQTAWMNLNGMPPLNQPTIPLSPTPYLQGKPVPPLPHEQAWKDTAQAHTGEVTVLRVRFAPTDGTSSFSFDATEGPGYVWHCHILDHEDNEMMRPYKVVPRAIN